MRRILFVLSGIESLSRQAQEKNAFLGKAREKWLEDCLGIYYSSTIKVLI
jgi:hypothetical protein